MTASESDDAGIVDPDTPGDEAPAEVEGRRAVPITLVPSDSVDDVLASLNPSEAAWATAQGFRGRLGQSLMLPDEEGNIDAVFLGWGTEESRARDRFHLGDFARSAPEGTYRLVSELSPDEAEEAALGWLLGRYHFEKFKRAGDERNADLLAPQGVDGGRLVTVVEGVFITRDLINTPANHMGPEALESACRRLAQRHEAEIEVITGDDLLENNLPMIHAVGAAGADAPRLIDFWWGPEDAPTVTLVGKGVCFDSGGLNIKPSGSMGLMKKDMGGAATVLGLAHMIMGLRLPVRLRVLIPAVENAISSGAMRPGDVLMARNGLSVEVNNTDAEGRLVLADALSLACEAEPELLIDMATLTGAARVALGPDIVPFYTDDEDLAGTLMWAANAAADPLWRLPLWPGYESDIEPEIADLDNAPKGGFAGSITAALFLKRFVDCPSWVHFDIYGWMPRGRPGRPAGGEAQAARALLRVIETRFGEEPSE